MYSFGRIKVLSERSNESLGRSKFGASKYRKGRTDAKSTNPDKARTAGNRIHQIKFVTSILNTNLIIPYVPKFGQRIDKTNDCWVFMVYNSDNERHYGGLLIFNHTLAPWISGLWGQIKLECLASPVESLRRI